MNDRPRANGAAAKTGRNVTEPNAAPLGPRSKAMKASTAQVFGHKPLQSAVVIRGRRRNPRDLYHWLLTISWGLFAVLGLSAYLVSNAVFGLLYLLDPQGISGARPGNFADAFFFSVQTIGTIGYGVLAPRDIYANCVMTIENFFGLSFVAVATGVIFARVSRPTARVMFSRNALITRYDGRPTLMFRAANERANRVLEAEVTVSLTRDNVTAEGRVMRRFQDLKVERARSPLFALTWSVMHVIDETSPLYGLSEDVLSAEGGQILVVLSGIDETFAQRIHARHAYLPSDVVWNRHFVDVILDDGKGGRVVDYGRFHDLEDLPPGANAVNVLDAVLEMDAAAEVEDEALS